MDQVRTFARNVASLTTANFLTNAVSAVVTIVVINYLGDERYGVFTAGMAFATVFLIFAETGVGMRLLYDRSGDKSLIDEHFGAALLLQVCPYLLSFVFTIAFAFVFHYPSVLISVIAIVSLAAVFRIFAETCEKVIYVYQQMHLSAILRSVRFLSVAIGGILVVWLDWGVLGWAIVQLVAMALYAALALPVTLRFARPKLVYGTLWPTLVASYMFGLGAIFFAIYERVDSVMLTKLLGENVMSRVGIYGSAYNVMTLTYTLPAAFIASMEPLVFAAKADPARLARLGNLSNRGIGLIAVPLNLAIALLAFEIRSLILPDIGSDVAVLLTFLPLYGFFRFMNFTAGMMMAAAGMQRARVVIQGVAVAFNITGNFICIPLFNIFGAAMMTVATELTIFAAYHLALRRRLPGYGFVHSVAKPFAAAAGMGVFILAAKYGLGLWFGPNRFAWLAIVPLGALLYFGILAAMRFFTDEERAFLKRVLARLPFVGGRNE
jgi:O-antigen/teichoic acid export membrane protein